jgi:hypothetical protein
MTTALPFIQARGTHREVGRQIGEGPRRRSSGLAASVLRL